jgi:rubrerythrin
VVKLTENFIEFLENMVELEKKIIESVACALKGIDNEAVTTALSGISLDSSKHALMYKSAISLLTSSSAALNEEQLDIQKDVITKHIKMEEAVIQMLEKKLPSIDDKKVELLLKAILSDEKRHHNLLTNLLEILVKGETITEGDWWDAIWGDVPGLWA